MKILEQEANIQFEELISSAYHLLRDDDLALIKKAFRFALEKSKTSVNSFEIPYVLQQLEIAKLAVTEINLAGKAIQSILLYLFPDEELNIGEEYSEKVESMVRNIWKIEQINTDLVKHHTENFLKLLLTQADDVRVLLIILAQKLYFTKNIHFLGSELQVRLAKELANLWAPLAHRLGLYAIKTEMEEMSLKYLHNDIYKDIARKLSETKRKREEYIKGFIIPIEQELQKNGYNYEIKGRPKSIHSIYNKIKKNKKEFEQIYDLFAIRIILDVPFDKETFVCWNVYSIVSDIYRPNPNRLRDWITSPKASGYESLHTTVIGPDGKWVEVQIRTKRMDEVAEKGHAAHWKYKEGEKAVGSTGWLSKIREALENPEPEVFEKEDTSKIDLYSDEIFIFTPKGDLLRLSQGATVLDFAYMIHSNVGNTCTGGKVNGKIVPMKHVLQNGDKVEIITQKNQTPKRDWLNIATSQRVKAKIKKFLKESEYSEADAGKEIIIRKLNQIKIKFGDSNVHKLVKFYKAKDVLNLYLMAAEEKLDFSKLKECFTEPSSATTRSSQIDDKIFSDKINKKLTQSDDNFLLIDESVDNVDYRLAPCCNPIHGDDIFGFVSSKSGITIHRINCPNAHDMLNRYPYRVVKTKWTGSSGNTSFLTNIEITGSDEIGIISNITQLISNDLKVNMRNLDVDSRDGNFMAKISVFIKDINHLDNLLNKIRGLKGVHSATRFDII